MLFKVNQSFFLTYEKNVVIYAYSIHFNPMQPTDITMYSLFKKLKCLHTHIHTCFHAHRQMCTHLYFIFLFTQNWILSMLVLGTWKSLLSIGTQYVVMYTIGRIRPTFQSCMKLKRKSNRFVLKMSATAPCKGLLTLALKNSYS